MSVSSADGFGLGERREELQLLVLLTSLAGLVLFSHRYWLPCGHWVPSTHRETG